MKIASERFKICHDFGIWTLKLIFFFVSHFEQYTLFSCPCLHLCRLRLRTFIKEKINYLGYIAGKNYIYWGFCFPKLSQILKCFTGIFMKHKPWNYEEWAGDAYFVRLIEYQIDWCIKLCIYLLVCIWLMYQKD